ncbi:MAG: hypothetical protein ACRBBS_15840 [Thalassovita sp.]
MSKLRCPTEEAKEAAKAGNLAPTANLIRDEISNLIYDWHADGGFIETVGRNAARIDMARIERSGERTAYSTEGKVILLTDKADPYNVIELVPFEESLGRNTRRTINRHFEKIDQPSKTSVDRRLVPFRFWESVALSILEFRLNQLEEDEGY